MLHWLRMAAEDIFYEEATEILQDDLLIFIPIDIFIR